jgi:hypothetical protein
MATLIEIEKYFETYNFIGEDVRIDKCTNVTNLKRFVQSHISILKKNSGNKLYLPYYYRLKKVYLLTKI